MSAKGYINSSDIAHQRMLQFGRLRQYLTRSFARHAKVTELHMKLETNHFHPISLHAKIHDSFFRKIQKTLNLAILDHIYAIVR